MIKPVETKKDHEVALQRCYDLMQKKFKPNIPQADELEILSILLENYEQKHYPVPPPNPVDAIKYMLQQTGKVE